MPLELTLPDLVVLSLVAERPMHGYELNQELERREVRDWARVSRPQVYYSLKKLARGGHLILVGSGAPRPGPERQMWRLAAAGRRALVQALAREEWAVQRQPLPFLTWMAVSALAEPDARLGLIRRRREFLSEQLLKERATLQAIARDTGPTIPAAALIVQLVIRHFEVELEWLNEVERKLAGPVCEPSWVPDERPRP